MIVTCQSYEEQKCHCFHIFLPRLFLWGNLIQVCFCGSVWSTDIWGQMNTLFSQSNDRIVSSLLISIEFFRKKPKLQNRQRIHGSVLTDQMFRSIYCLPKLHEDNVFSRVCLFIHKNSLSKVQKILRNASRSQNTLQVLKWMSMRNFF